LCTGKNMSFRIPRTLLVVASVLVVLGAVQTLMFTPTAQATPIPKPRMCVVGTDGETSGCGAPFPNPNCRGTSSRGLRERRVHLPVLLRPHLIRASTPRPVEGPPPRGRDAKP
jgi:hypothetical protein